MQKNRWFLLVLLLVAAFLIHGQFNHSKKFAIILQAGMESHEGMARAVHAFLYSNELKDAGHKVVLIFDGAGTEWAQELSDPESKSKVLPAYKQFKESGVIEVICDYCAVAFKVKDELIKRETELVSEYKGHPSIEKWVKKM